MCLLISSQYGFSPQYLNFHVNWNAHYHIYITHFLALVWFMLLASVIHCFSYTCNSSFVFLSFLFTVWIQFSISELFHVHNSLATDCSLSYLYHLFFALVWFMFLASVIHCFSYTYFLFCFLKFSAQFLPFWVWSGYNISFAYINI